MNRLALCAALLTALAGCATPEYGASYPGGPLHSSETHNDLDGFRDACGDLPGLQGDDC